MKIVKNSSWVKVKSFSALICATFTDLRVLCGPDYNKCFSIYGSSILRVPGFQEVAKLLFSY